MPSSHLSVLVVDDDHWSTRAISAVLGAQPSLHVLPAEHDGEAAVAAYRTHRPDVVLMDVNMPPGMSGVDATAQIVAGDPDARIVLLTTVSPGPGIARALDAGALAAVNKSAPDDVLVQTVLRAARGESLTPMRQLAEDIALSGDVLPEAPALAPELTERELATLRLICEGLEYDEIAAHLMVSTNTVKSHAGRLRDKLGAHSHAQLMVQAMKYRFVSPL